MAMSGVKVADEVKNALLEFKTSKKRFIAIQMSDDYSQFCFDEEMNSQSKMVPSEVDEDVERADYKEFREMIKTCKKPHTIYYNVRSNKGDKITDKIVTFNWCLDSFPVKAKTVYSASENAIKASVEMGNAVSLSIHEDHEYDYEEVLQIVLKKK